MKIEVKSVREAGLMPKMKNPSDHLQTVSAQQKINKKKHNAKLESLSKDDLNKIFQKYKDKVSSEGLESANGNNNYKEDLALNNNNYNNSSNNNNKGKHSKKMSLSSPRQKKDNKPEPIQEQLKTTENLTEPTKDQTITIEKIVKKDESPIKEENQNSPLEIKEEPKLLAKKSLDKTNEPDKPVQINLHAKKNINLKAQKSLGLTEPLQKPNEETKEIEEEVNNEKNIEDIVKLESPIKENEIIKESPLKPDTSKDQNEYDEEIFEESIEKN